MLDEAIVIGFALVGISCWYFGLNTKSDTVNKYITVLRILFITAGFGCFEAMFAVMATFVTAYTIPANSISSNSLQPYYSTSVLAGTQNLLYAFAWIMGIAMVFYIGLEVIFYFKNLAEMAGKKKDMDYNKPYGR